MTNSGSASGWKFSIGVAAGLIVAAAAVMVYSVGDRGSRRTTERDAAERSEPAPARDFEELQLALAAEVEERKKIAAKLRALEEAVSRLGSRVAQVDDPDTAIELSERDGRDGRGSESNALDGAQPTATKSGEPSQFNDEALLALGVHPRDVDRLRDRWVAQELEAAEISNQALREGWFQQPRHRNELIRLEMSLRQSLDDSEYDQYLFALGKPNRLETEEVLTGSYASEAGLLRGDVIVRYDDRRVFRSSDLLVASSRGGTTSSVPMEILRDGRRETLYVRPGPLGALTKEEHAEPLLD